MISIIIPTLNEEGYIGRLLKSIKEQSYTDYEIIVADAGSKDRTTKIAKEYGCRIVKGGVPARGRNQGAKHATGQYLLFLDADVILTPHFLRDLRRMFIKKKLVCATAWKKIDSNNMIDACMYLLADAFFFATGSCWPRAPGTCIMISREVFGKLWFDETMFLSEDVDLVYRTRQSRLMSSIMPRS